MERAEREKKLQVVGGRGGDGTGVGKEGKKKKKVEWLEKEE